MKKILPFLIFLIPGFGAYSQITIRTDDIIEKPVSKPLTFDSLSNLKAHDKAIDYKQYLGHKLFFVPWSKKYPHEWARRIDYLFTNKKSIVRRPERVSFEESDDYGVFKLIRKRNKKQQKIYEERKAVYTALDTIGTYVYKPKFYPIPEASRTDKKDGNIYTAPEEIDGKYFTILDIRMQEYKNWDKTSKYDKLEDIGDYSTSNRIQLTLKDDLTNDTVYFRTGSVTSIGDGDFFLVPYFVKQKNTYLNQRLVAKKKFSYLVDINTGAEVEIRPGEIWLCTDVSFTDLKQNHRLTPLVYLKNGEKTVTLEFKFLDKDSFIFEREVLRRKAEDKKLADQKLKEEQAREREVKADELKRRNHLIKIYGQKVGAYIAEGNIVLGMTKEMCRAAWGDPMDINTTTVSGLTREQWVYGGGNYLYFDNGTLKVIQR